MHLTGGNALRKRSGARIIVASMTVVILVGCGGGGISTAARDKCEASAGVGRCVERDGKWLPIGSIGGTLPATSTSTSTTITPRTTTTRPRTQALTGDFTIIQDEIKDDPSENKHIAVCSGINGYDDLQIGTEVIVKNESGVTIATGAIDHATWVNVHTNQLPGTPGVQGIPAQDIGGVQTPAIPGIAPTPPSEFTSGDCTLAFTVTGVPPARFYTVQVSHRGGGTYSQAQLNASGWRLHLTLS